MLKSLVKAKQFVALVDKFLGVFLPHLLYLNWTSTQLKSITDQENPRLPIGDILVGFDFSQSPSFMKSGMGQRHYQQNQIFGLFSFSVYWTKLVEGTTILRKGVYMLTFSNAKHNSARAQQCFDIGMESLKTDLDKEGIKPVNIFVYTDCCPGDQKNRFFLTHFSSFHENNPWSR